jgi:lipopolysaccharide export system protein LptA
MICNFHAAMRNALIPLLAAAALLGAGGALAERADRNKPLAVEADSPSKLDLQKQIVTFNGNVVVTKGTLQIRADRIEVRETGNSHAAVATGTAAQPATFRQKRDGVDEWIEGRADRLEYDGRSDTVRFVGNAQIRRMRGGSVADEVSGGLITYDNAAEVFSVTGGSAAAGTPGGRVRAVLVPRDAPASAPAGDKASEPKG